MIRGKWEGTINIPEGTSNDYAIKHFKRNGPVHAHNLRTIVFGQPQQTIPFEGESTWHELTYSGGQWMTDLPIEQAQHDREMAPMEGAENVLVGGLGLGYAVHKLVRDYDVERIDVVEISQDVINLVWPHVASDVKALCVLHHADLFKYIEENQDKEWDFGFYDIWQSDGECTFHDMVVPLRQQSLKICDEVICWNEDIMRGQLLQGMVTRQFVVDGKLEGPSDGATVLKQLCDADDKFINWSKPFWRAYRDRRFSPEKFQEAALYYVQRYGVIPNWECCWEIAMSDGRFM